MGLFIAHGAGGYAWQRATLDVPMPDAIVYALVVRITIYERGGPGTLNIVERDVTDISLIWAPNWWEAWLIVETTKGHYDAWRERNGLATETSFELYPVLWMHRGRLGGRRHYVSRM